MAGGVVELLIGIKAEGQSLETVTAADVGVRAAEPTGMASKAETRVVNLAGLVQGITLVTFPAAGTIFTSPPVRPQQHRYGAMFLPQVVTAIATSLLGAAGRRFTASGCCCWGWREHRAMVVLVSRAPSRVTPRRTRCCSWPRPAGTGSARRCRP
jgi:hypothetical protein